MQARAQAPTVTRPVTALIAGNKLPFVCADGTSISIAHLMEAIPGLIDGWLRPTRTRGVMGRGKDAYSLLSRTKGRV